MDQTTYQIKWVEKGSEFYNRSMKSRLKKMVGKCVQRIMKDGLWWVNDLLEP